ncbi:hypothetical protein ACFIJ5_18505 (plasmid) [Haloimpatiens sp. FM7330]|uniref:hypothetical protein n=1 Tax=Haloimpatiens sp. FM7330 TaxID=3298610 RepID=UPI0036328A88
MTFNYSITKEEFLNFHKKYVVNTIQYNKFFIENLIGLVSLFLIMFIFISAKFRISVIIAFVGSSLIFFILRKKYYLNSLNKNEFKKLYSYHNLKYLFAETLLTIDSSGITIDTVLNKKTIKWKYIKDFYIVDDNVIIRSFSDYDIFIPSSSIKSKEDLESLINLFEENASIYPEYSYPMDIEFI